jgi:phosphoribosylglycinamide formyltransferase-1
LEIQHVEARKQSEIDFFSDYIGICEDESNPKLIRKGAINNEAFVNEIIAINPDLLICYGSSLIKSNLLTKFEENFLNVHLGL